MLKSLLRVLFVGLVLALGVAQADNTVDDFTDPAKPIYLDSKNSTLVVKLKSNPTTGYSWYLQSIDAPWLQPISHRYVAPSSKLMGAPGYDLWTFKVDPAYQTVPFYTEIELIYTRAWQVNSSPTVLRVFYKPTEQS